MVHQHDGSTATYQPGVDVRGRAVVPADLGAQSGSTNAIVIPEAIDINIDIDLADWLGRRDRLASRALLPAQGRAQIGVLTIKGIDAFWNGEKIAPRDQVALAEACRKALGAGNQVLPVPKPSLSEK